MLRTLPYLAFFIGIGFLTACSSGGGKTADGGCPPGSETCACYGNATCNAGLTCASNLCVNLGGMGGGGSGGSISTGGGGGGASATGGTAGDGGSGGSAGS